MNIEVGKRYRTRDGKIRTVTKERAGVRPFCMDDEYWVCSTGVHLNDPDDLVSEVKDQDINSDFLSVVQAFYNGEKIIWRMKGSGDPWESLEYSDPLWNLEKYEYKVKHVGREFWLSEIEGKMTVIDYVESCMRLGSFKVREVIEEE